MPDKLRIFVAYASQPEALRQMVRNGIHRRNSIDAHFVYESWEQNDVAGRPLTDPIFQKIESAAALVADISILNLNVVYEVGYLRSKDSVWLLIDNLDKGWATQGVSKEDVIIIRALIDAARKIEHDMRRRGLEFHVIVFVRNDVYDFLISETADRGKETRVSLDWSDADLLRQMLKQRMVYNGLPDREFEDIWRTICVSHVNGEETSQYLIDRALMRPRYLLNLINHCKSVAVNLGHEKITGSDLQLGMARYSADIVTDTEYELRDIVPEARDIFYIFLGEGSELTERRIIELLESRGLPNDKAKRVVDALIWFGFLGIRVDQDEVKYIYSFRYDFKKFVAFARRSSEVKYCLHPAFWPALELSEQSERQLF